MFFVTILENIHEQICYNNLVNVNLDSLATQITAHTLFQRSKDVIENINGSHDHESVYDHLLKTALIARKEREGNFITNAKAKQRFITYMNQEISGVQKKDIAVLTALLHDSGKILSYTENDEAYPMNISRANGQTACPGHEYWGAEIVVPEILADINLPERVKEYIKHIIKMHDTFMHGYFKPRETWTLEDTIQDLKSKAEGEYKEVLFNIYCDLYTAPSFSFVKPIIENIFSSEMLYIPRQYGIPGYQ